MNFFGRNGIHRTLGVGEGAVVVEVGAGYMLTEDVKIQNGLHIEPKNHHRQLLCCFIIYTL